jgi:hypothetical protein
VCTCIHTYIHTYINICVHTWVFVCTVCILIPIYDPTHAHTHTHAYIHTYMHTYIHTYSGIAVLDDEGSLVDSCTINDVKMLIAAQDSGENVSLTLCIEDFLKHHRNLQVCMYVCTIHAQILIHVCINNVKMLVAAQDSGENSSLTLCRYVCMYVCMYTYVCMYVCMYAYVHVCIYVCMYVCILCGCKHQGHDRFSKWNMKNMAFDACLHIYTHTYTHTHIHTYIHICVHVSTYIHTYMYLHT